MEDLVVNNRLTIPSGQLSASYSRSSGPGGQNVNKVNSRVTLRWRIGDQPVLPPDWLQRFLVRNANRISRDGDVVINSDRYRDQPRNLEDCRQRLAELLRECSIPPVKRKKTRPSLASKRRRLDDKRRTGEKKSMRRSLGD